MNKANRMWKEVLKPMILGTRSDQDENLKKLYEDTQLHNWTYYGSNKSGRDIAKQLRFLDRLKYRMLMPAMNFVNIIKAGKLRTKPDTEGPQDQQLRAFERAWESAKLTWAAEYLVTIKDRTNLEEDEYLAHIEQRKAFRTVESIKEFVMMLPLNDDAYHVFLDILLQEIAKEVGKEAKKGKIAYLAPRGKYVKDVQYYNLARMMRSGDAFIWEPQANSFRNVPKDMQRIQ